MPDLSIITCASGRFPLYARHLAHLAKAVGACQCEYSVTFWGDCEQHKAELAKYKDAFYVVRVQDTPADPYFPLPQAMNASLDLARADRCLVLMSEVVVQGDTLAWARSRPGRDAWFAGCIDSKDGKECVTPGHPGAFPYCMALPTDALRRIGGWDEAFSDGVVFDDVDLILRLLASGIRCRWDFEQLVVHQAHERAHDTKTRSDHVAHNKALVEQRLGGYPIADAWPAWWRELFTGQEKEFPELPGMAEQNRLADALRQHGYPIKATRKT